MGMFNTVVAEAECPWCRQISTYSIQFKYGELGLYDYLLGETLKWGEKGYDEEGRKDVHQVLVRGLGGSCRYCGSREEDNGIEFCVLIEENVLKSVFPLSDLWSDDYLILDDIGKKHHHRWRV
jgi:hypothetical protein